MPITILDYVNPSSVDKDFYTAEDCLISGVDIIGGCQACAATIAIYNAYPSTSGYWRCADCIGDTGFATVTDFTAHPSMANCPSAATPTPSAKPASPPANTPRNTRWNAATAAWSGSHDHTPALDWLNTRFEEITRRYAADFRYAAGHRKTWHGPEHVRPMIEFLSVMDAGPSMRVIPGDYDDPGRWPL